jgi:acyl-coenzyme A synthetase/AMP-(fatty) acid ligase
MVEVPGFNEAFLAQVETRPNDVALVWHTHETTYRELYEMASKAGAQLVGLDLGPDEPVGVLAKKSPAAVALVLACLLAGRRFLLPSPALAERTLTSLFARADCRYALVPDSDPIVIPPAPGPPALRVVDQTDDVSFMLTTSGSTGLPKIVPLAQSGVDRFVAWAADAFDIGPGRSVLNYAPLNFDLCLLDVWTTLAHGGRVVMIDPARAANGYHLLDQLSRHEVHVLQAVPMFYSLLIYGVMTRDPERVFPSVEHVMFTGDAIPDCTLEQLTPLFPSARLHNIYGCTETNDSFVHEVDRETAGKAGPIPLGTPVSGAGAEIVGVDGAVLHGSGMGELYVSTPFQTTGYLNRPDQDHRFVAHPHGWDDRRYFRTGDLVRRDQDGQVFLVGRSDFQVKVRGVAVNTAEVERVLLDHPEVNEAAVVAKPDDLAGNILQCAVQRTPGSRLNSLTLRGHCAKGLPQAAIPTVLCIFDEPLPKTSTGKVDRNAVSFPDVSPTARGRVS